MPMPAKEMRSSSALAVGSIFTPEPVRVRYEPIVMVTVPMVISKPPTVKDSGAPKGSARLIFTPRSKLPAMFTRLALATLVVRLAEVAPMLTRAESVPSGLNWNWLKPIVGEPKVTGPKVRVMVAPAAGAKPAPEEPVLVSPRKLKVVRPKVSSFMPPVPPERNDALPPTLTSSRPSTKKVMVTLVKVTSCVNVSPVMGSVKATFEVEAVPLRVAKLPMASVTSLAVKVCALPVKTMGIEVPPTLTVSLTAPLVVLTRAEALPLRLTSPPAPTPTVAEATRA